MFFQQCRLIIPAVFQQETFDNLSNYSMKLEDIMSVI